MFKTTAIPAPKTRLAWSLACLLGTATAMHAFAAEEISAARAAAPTYSIVHLGTGSLAQIPDINASGQVTFSLFNGENLARAWFYDGKTARDIGTLGGPTAIAAKLNDAGQVVGLADSDTLGHYRAFVWSKGTGMVDIGSLNGDASSAASDINKSGQVAGVSIPGGPSAPRAFLWSRTGGVEALGTLGTDFMSTSSAVAINDAGLISGTSSLGSPSLQTHAFAWTRDTGMVDIGTLGGDSYVAGVGAKGEVAGYSYVGEGILAHAFIWTRSGGMRDLGAAGGLESFPLAMSASAQVIGVINLTDGDSPVQHPMSWTAAGGMKDLGTFGGSSGRALGVNNKGQVVGWSSYKGTETSRAFSWTSAHGMVDLNKFVHRMPKGMRLETAVAVSDTGLIVAQTNTGLVLLKPGSGCGCGPVTGPIAAPEMVAVGSPYAPTATFANEDTAATHSVGWTWGDGSSEQAAKASERDGAGSASAMHVYTRSGIYTVSAQVADRSGKSATVSRNVIVYDPAGGFAGGMGSFISPQGANKKTPLRSGKASFSFVAPSRAVAARTGGKPQLFFSTVGLAFRSEDFAPVAVQAGSARFEGSGKVNGAEGYRFALTTTAGAANAGGFALKIWHTDPATRAQVVDYDNQAPARRSAAAATAVVGEGSVVVEGQIAVQL